MDGPGGGRPTPGQGPPVDGLRVFQVLPTGRHPTNVDAPFGLLHVDPTYLGRTLPRYIRDPAARADIAAVRAATAVTVPA
ncbi:hypothetical protein GCM10009682_37890 [Luedemannella flava]|uniref:Uncharacterized protein n=1 Tax=Luedemannella flava TaxID=349316 RepID=A0ABP4YFI3_9ACTN